MDRRAEKSVAELEAQFLRCTKGSIEALFGLSAKGALGQVDDLWHSLTEYVNFMSGVLDQKQ